jgi:FkbM family methyltransferase
MSAKTLLRKLLKARRLARHPVYRRGLQMGVGAAIEHEDVVRNSRIGTLVDVGANVGQFSLLVRRFWPDAQLMAFEPLQGPGAKYRKLFEQDAKAKLLPYAAGPEEAKAEIHVAAKADSSSLLPISDLQTQLHPGTQEVGTESIEIRRPDDVLPVDDLAGPVFVKIDVQGFELEALKGMPRLLAKAAAVYIEVSFVPLYTGQPLASEIIDFMHGAGFEIVGVHNLAPSSKGESVQADMLFRPKAR